MRSESNHTTELDTFPKYLARNADVFRNRPAMREKDFGIWQAWTWADQYAEIRALACGFAALGVKRDDKIAIVGDNRPRLYWTMVAAQCVGAVPVPVYQDSVADEMQFILEHAGAAFVVVEDQEQVDKMLEIKDRCPEMTTIIFDDPRGMRHYDQSFLHDFEKVQEMGRKYDAANSDFYETSVARGKGSDTGIMLYTSGTTGRPKGVVLSFDNLVKSGVNSVAFEGLNETDDVLAYLPMAWVGDNVFSLAQAYVAAFCVSCPENGETVMTDMREIGPTYYFAPPRVFENLLTSVTIRMEDAGQIKRKMFKYFMAHAKAVGIDIIDGKPVSLMDRLKYTLGEFLIYGPLKNVLGMSRVKLAYTAGEAVGPEIFSFYRSLGINIKQLYGQTESTVFITIQPNGEIYADTVGVPAPGVEVKINDDGEVIYRGAGAFVEYYKNPKATAETKNAEGWVLTGDAGYFDERNHLRIIDRAKDVGKLNDGSMFAPKFLENKLKFFPQIKEVVTFGHEKDYVTAFINIDLEAVGSWAERQNLAYSGYTDLASRDIVYDLIQTCVEEANADLATDPHLSGSQVKRYLILHKELDADDGELTRTRKVRRSFVAEKYADLIDALYSDKDTIHVDAEVTFEDGRKGKIEADLQIREAKIIEPKPLKMAS